MPVTFSVVMPTTFPARSINGPLLFPGLIAASVCSRTTLESGPVRRRALMIPRVTVP